MNFSANLIMHAEDWDEEFYRVESTPTLFGNPKTKLSRRRYTPSVNTSFRLWLLKTPKAPKRVLEWAAVVSPAC
jgi:hypothetical protein